MSDASWAPLLEGLRGGKRSALARAISMVENRAPAFEELLHEVHPSLGRARRIGITGPPGAGKSTLTSQLTTRFRGIGATVGVVAVDPSSPYTGGALLGDRIRMGAHSTDPGVFLRSMSVRGSAGGVASMSGEVMDLLDAFGFDIVLLEAVGAGQSEVALADCVDTTVLVLVPESGDSVQAMKAGLMEIADIVVINKADRPGAGGLARDVEAMLHLKGSGSLRGGAFDSDERSPDGREPRGNPADTWEVPVLLTTASDGIGLDLLMEALEAHGSHLEASGELQRRRRRRWASRTRTEVDRELRKLTWTEEGMHKLAEGVELMESGVESPYSLAARIARGGRG